MRKVLACMYDVDQSQYSTYHMHADSAQTMSRPDPDLHVNVCSAPFQRTQTWTRLQVPYAHFILAHTVHVQTAIEAQQPQQ